MKLANLFVFCLAAITSNLGFCADFNERGVALDLPAGFTAVKSNSVSNNMLSRSFAWQNAGTPPVILHVLLSWLTHEEEKLGRTLTTKSPSDAAGLCLAVDMEHLRSFTKDLAATNAREIWLSKKLGGVATFSGVAEAPNDRKAGLDTLQIMIYCVSEPKREIVFRVIGPADQANSIFNDVVHAVENVVISDE